LVLSYRIDTGTPPKKAKTWPSQNALIVSAYALMKNALECGGAVAK
jgi:hypothetical protein